MKGLDSSSSGVYPMSDIHTYYIYENQRWNPLSGLHFLLIYYYNLLVTQQ